MHLSHFKPAVVESRSSNMEQKAIYSVFSTCYDVFIKMAYNLLGQFTMRALSLGIIGGDQ